MEPGSASPNLPVELYVALFEQAADGMFVVDLEGRLIAANSRLHELLGFPAGEALGRPFQDFADPGDLRDHPVRFAELRAGNVVISERLLRHREGRRVPVELTTRMLADGHLVGVVRDLTERHRVEEALRTEVDRFRTLARVSNTGAWEWHRERAWLWCSPEYFSMLGRDAAQFDLSGRPNLDEIWVELLHPDDRDRAIRHFADYLAAGSPGLYESTFRLRHLDGHYVWVWSRGSTLRDEEGNPTDTTIGTHIDFTDRKQAEEALRASEESYRTLVEQASDGVVTTDAEGRCLDANATYLGMLGYSLEELRDLRLQDVVVDEPQPRLAEHLEKVTAGAESLAEWRLRRKDGSQFPVEVSARLLEDGRRLAIVRDITGRRVAERAMEEEDRPYGVVFTDSEFRVQRVNDAFGRLLGYAPEELVGRSIAELTRPDDQGETRALTGRLKRQEIDQFVVEKRYVTRTGDTVHAVTFVRGLYSTAGGFDGAVAFVVDITERARAEEARLEMERRMLHAQKLESLGVLAGGIAHDFNNLLMAMLGNLELAQRDLSPVSSSRPRLAAASHAARRAADLTRQMLAYSGRGKFLIRQVNLNELVEENVHLLRTSIPRTVTLNLHLDRALPAVEADAGQIQQVTMNLITNAAEAIGGEPGVVTLSTGVRDCDGSYLGRSCLDERPPAGRYVYVEVTDTGCGMDEETQKRMFEPFFTTKFTGRGLGLPAVFGIVRGHGGAILLDSAVGRGTTIRVLFPASGGAPAAAETAPAAVVEAAPGAGRGTILIVDDEEMVLQPCAAMVEYMGFTVLTAADGEEAVEMVRRHGASIRAIILDLTMPKLDGAAALERILLIEPGAQVILSSGYDEAEATGRVAKGQLAGFIRKPYYLEQLRTTLERVLGTAL